LLLCENADAFFVLFLQEQLNLALMKPVESLLEADQKDTWASIKELLKGETQVAVAKLSTNIAGFELDQATVDKKVQKLRDYGRDLVEKKGREKAGEVLIRMKAR
jgi:predicted transcriptional regulator